MRLFRKRSIWLPTWPVAVGAIAIMLLLCGLLFFGSHGFLAMREPVEGAEVLVVESWLADVSMEEVAEILRGEQGSYRDVWLVGPPVSHGTYLSPQYKSFAEVGRATLVELGVSAERLHVAPAVDVHRHRTFEAGNALRETLSAAGALPEKIDVATLDVHARRSRLVYSKLFPDAEIGVIALAAPAYSGDDWFKSSSGMKNVIFEVIAFLYEKFGDSGRP